MDLSTRVPPNDIEAEQAVLSSMLFDRDAIIASHEILRGDDFYRPDHKAIFDAMIALFEQNVPVDAVTLKDKLTRLGVLEQVGGADYLAVLATGFYTSANIRHYAKIVEEKSTLRKLILAANEISNEGFAAAQPVPEILESAEKRIFDIAQGRNSGEFSHIGDVLVSATARIEKAYSSKVHITGLATHFAEFDEMTAGLQTSDLILIAARPSMGKTAFALNIAQNIAVRQNVPTAIFSLEMAKEQLVNRLLCAEASVDSQRLRTGDLEDSDFEKIVGALPALSHSPIYIDDTPAASPADIRAKCRRLKLEKGLGLIVIDYLQLMNGAGRAESRQQEISEISRSLKAIAREMEAPLVALSQLSRAPESRADHRPMLSDMRESGAIEQDADVVAFLYRDEYYHPDTEKHGIAEIIIAKQRNGPTGTIELAWLNNYTKFGNLERGY